MFFSKLVLCFSLKPTISHEQGSAAASPQIDPRGAFYPQYFLLNALTHAVEVCHRNHVPCNQQHFGCLLLQKYVGFLSIMSLSQRNFIVAAM